MSTSARELALFNLAINSKLWASDLVRLKVEDACSGPIVRDRAIITQLNIGRPVQFEITEVTRQSAERLLAVQSLSSGYLFRSERMDTRTSRRGSMLASYIGGSATWDSMTAVSEHIRSGEPRLRSSIARRETSGQSSCYLATQRSRQPSAYLGVEVDDALRLAEQIEV